jgi:hypothetical protein
MPLPSLQWRKLPVRTLGTTGSFSANFVLENIYDMLTGSLYHDGSTRTINSGSAWSASGKFQTGSNVEAVICRPPLNTILSQSVIFSARASAAPSSSATPPAYNPDVYTSSVVHIACVKNASGSFTEWTSRHPFGSGSFSSGYLRATNIFNAFTKLVMYESKEALCIQVINNNINCSHIALAGALIDPEKTNSTQSADVENDGRIYAVTTAGVPLSSPTTAANGVNINFLSNRPDQGFVGDFLSNNSASPSTAANPYSRFIFMYPNTNITGSALVIKRASTATAFYTSYTTLSGQIVQNPMYTVVHYSSIIGPGYFLGRLREITAIKNMPTNTVIRGSSNNVIGFTLGASESGLSEAVSLNYL